MKREIAILLLLGSTSWLFSQDKPAYRIFTGQGEAVQYDAMIGQLGKADIVFFGEQHNSAVAHWLELEVTRDLFRISGQNLILGAEMFETDNQILIQEFWEGFINEKKFEEDCRLWKNYPTDYKPLLTFARENGLSFIATNAPRRYASLVASKGLEALDKLSDQAKTWLPPLPIAFDPEVPCYKKMLDMGGMGGGGGAMAAHGGMNLLKAQAIKDATMAHFINLNDSTDKQVIHFNGSWHSDYHEGIIWYLTKLQPASKILVISTVTQKNLDKLEEENQGKGDFVVVSVEGLVTY